MGIIVWLMMGGIVGWIASMIMGNSARQGIILNVVVGIVGAMLGGWLIGPQRGPGKYRLRERSPARAGGCP